MAAYYNEHDPKAAAWIRELIKQGHVTDGVVDERSIEDVLPNELAGFTQCHFFAGIGVWSYALRRAGWPDDRAVWTGSCPCQPFSAAGKGDGFADERHLWPAWFQLIAQCRPAVVLGEQVASKDGLNWLDLVYADLEDAGYSVGAADLCAAGVGAPHIRQRLWFVADTGRLGREFDRLDLGSTAGSSGGRAWEQRVRADGGAGGQSGSMAHPQRPGLQVRADADLRGTVGHDEGRLVVESGHGGVRDLGDAARGGARPQRGDTGEVRSLQEADREQKHRPALPGGSGEAGGLADADGGHASAEREQRGGQQRLVAQDGRSGGLAHDDGVRLDPASLAGLHDAQHHAESRGADGGLADAVEQRPSGDAGPQRGIPGGADLALSGGVPAGARPGPTNGGWASPDWIFCRDGKWRPVESGLEPLAHGSPQRVGRLRGYGNAIVAAAAQTFIEATGLI